VRDIDWRLLLPNSASPGNESRNKYVSGNDIVISEPEPWAEMLFLQTGADFGFLTR